MNYKDLNQKIFKR